MGVGVDVGHAGEDPALHGAIILGTIIIWDNSHAMDIMDDGPCHDLHIDSL